MTSGTGPRWLGLPPIDGAPGPAEKIDVTRAAALVEGALVRHFGPARSKPSRRWRYAVAAVMVCGLAGVAAAALVVLRPHRAPPGREEPVAAPASPRAVRRQLSPAAAEPRLDPPGAETEAPVERARVGRAATGVDLLELANRLRRQGAWRSAERLYARVAAGSVETWPRYIAGAAAASIALEHLNDPGAALRLYERARATRPGGELDGEILWGIAVSARALNQGDREAAALRQLVAGQPGSVFHALAQRRLSELAADEGASER